MIFTLHRSIGLDDAKKAEIFREAEEKLDWIRKEKFRQIAEEVKDVEIYQFLKSITWGYQVRQRFMVSADIIVFFFAENASAVNKPDNDLSSSSGVH